MKKILSLLSLLACLILSGQAMAYTISINPVPQTIHGGESTTVDINLALSGSEFLNYFNLELSFDNAILGFNETSSTTLGDTNLDYVSGFTDIGNYIAFDGINLINPLSNGTFTLASLNFTGIGLGTSLLTLADGQVSGGLDLSPNFDLLEAITPATANVNVVPEPGTFLLLGLGLAGLVGYRRKFQKA